MEFSVTASGADPFYYNTITLEPPNDTIGFIPANTICAGGTDSDKCRLIQTVEPILEFFSAVTSYETVEACYLENQERTLLRETGQRVAFVLLVRAMFQSNCPYFNRFSPLLADYQLARTQEMFLLASLMATRQEEAAFAEMPPCPLGSGLQEHLFPLLQEARHHLVRDAAVNAVTIMCNLATLAADEAEEAGDLTLPALNTVPLPPADLSPTGA